MQPKLGTIALFQIAVLILHTTYPITRTQLFYFCFNIHNTYEIMLTGLW